MFQMKEQEKRSEIDLNEMERSKLPDKELTVMVIKMFTELGGRMDEHRENFSKEIENMRNMSIKQVTELKNTIAELKKYTRWAQ